MKSIDIQSTPGAPPPIELPGRKLSRDEVNALPLFHYSGKVTLVRTPEEMRSALARMRDGGSNGSGRGNGRDEGVILGFDTETRPSFRKGKSYAPSLIQLALADEVFLFHLKWMPLHEELIAVFEDESVIKTGVAVHDDMRFLSRMKPFTARSVVDLSEVARRNGIESRGLRGLAAAFLGLRISKGEQCSNWGNSELSVRQVRYAATDAWTSRAVYISMLEAGLDFTRSEPLKARRKRTVHRVSRPRKRTVPFLS